MKKMLASYQLQEFTPIFIRFLINTEKKKNCKQASKYKRLLIKYLKARFWLIFTLYPPPRLECSVDNLSFSRVYIFNFSTINSVAELTRLQESIIRSLFDCDFRATYRELIVDRIDTGCAKCEPFYACVNHHFNLNVIISCLPKVEKACNASQIRIIKTIRLSMKQAEKLLEQYPNLLILHLLRDPRAILKSRTVLQDIPGDNFPQILCDGMKQNIIIYESLVEKFKDRLSTLYYEDLAEDSVRIAQLIYERLDLKFTNHAKKWVEDMMLGEDVKGYSYEVQRRNAVESSRKWRLQIEYELVKETDKVCKDFYQRTGFLPVSNETMLRKTNLKLRKKSNLKNTIV